MKSYYCSRTQNVTTAHLCSACCRWKVLRSNEKRVWEQFTSLDLWVFKVTRALNGIENTLHKQRGFRNVADEWFLMVIQLFKPIQAPSFLGSNGTDWVCSLGKGTSACLLGSINQNYQIKLKVKFHQEGSWSSSSGVWENYDWNSASVFALNILIFFLLICKKLLRYMRNTDSIWYLNMYEKEKAIVGDIFI